MEQFYSIHDFKCSTKQILAFIRLCAVPSLTQASEEFPGSLSLNENNLESKVSHSYKMKRMKYTRVSLTLGMNDGDNSIKLILSNNYY